MSLIRADVSLIFLATFFMESIVLWVSGSTGTSLESIDVDLLFKSLSRVDGIA